MYAVIRSGGKQYRVQKGDVIAVERLNGRHGDKVKFADVLMLGEAGKAPTVGTPLVAGAGVSAEVVEQTRADKIKVVKFRRRKNYQRTIGHRQHQTVLKITDIAAKKTASKAKVETKAAPKKKTTTTKKPTTAKKASKEG